MFLFAFACVCWRGKCETVRVPNFFFLDFCLNFDFGFLKFYNVVVRCSLFEAQDR